MAASSSSLPKIPPPGPSSIPPPSLIPVTAAPAPNFTPVKPEPATPSASTPVTPHRPPLPPPPSDADIVHIPTYSKWFLWNSVHDCEVRFLPEFFDSRSPNKNPTVYMYYRNSIIKQFRSNPSAKITFTEVRKRLVGDVGSIRRVFDFLEAWGLINYSPSAVNKPLKWEEKETKSSLQSGGGDGGGSSNDSPHNRDSTKRLCSGCKSECTIACFVCDKYELSLCARCYVRNNYRVGVSSSDFRRVEISEEVRTEWTDKETLQLLEAVTHCGDDWRKVSSFVPGRTEKDCVTHFIKLPFGEQFSGYADLGKSSEKYDLLNEDADGGPEPNGLLSSDRKKMRLTPLADASNPIMAQVAFLSALAGTEVAEAAAQAAVKTLAEIENRPSKDGLESLSEKTFQGASVAANGETNQIGSERTSLDAKSLVEKEEADAETTISTIVEVKMQEIQDKINRFEKLDLVMEEERKQFEQMKNLLFVDQLVLLFHKKDIPKTGEHKEPTN